MLFILKCACTYFMFTYAVSPVRSNWRRVGSLAMIIVTWFVPWGWIPGMIWGGLCWADSRAGFH